MVVVMVVFGLILANAETLAEAVERMELSAVIAGRKPARSAAEIRWKHLILSCCSLLQPFNFRVYLDLVHIFNEVGHCSLRYIPNDQGIY